MYSSLSIKNFRGIESLQLEDTRRINLIVGRNNAGKSTVLESLFLLGSATNTAAALSIAQLRDPETLKADRLWRPFFHNADPGTPIEVEGQWNYQPRRLKISAIKAEPGSASADPKVPSAARVATISDSLTIGGLALVLSNGDGVQSEGTIKIPPGSHNMASTSGSNGPDTGILPTTLVSARGWTSMPDIARQFSDLVKIKQEDSVVEALKSIDTRISRLDVLSDGGSAAVYADIGLDSLLPLSAAGEGLMRLLIMAVAFAGIRGGVLLVDEIDNGLHHSVMDTLWTFLDQQCERFKVQMFATTHSDEMLRSALRSLSGESKRPGLFRIDVRNGRHVATSYGADAIVGVLESNFEVRS